MIILGKGTVITRDADRPIIYDGAVAIDGTQIVDIGTYDELCKTYANAEIIAGIDMNEIIRAETFEGKTTKNINFTGLDQVGEEIAQGAAQSVSETVQETE
jgi:hypothetical protein